jgi:2-polyprenyl-3-methyl-5-hydroxy-6-metoxy-1,4-benzoquinol methylase
MKGRKPFSDERIVESWHRNAAPWTSAVRENQIESRRLVTNKAIVDAVLGRSPKTVLDLGCGEGWLVRELSSRGVRATGIDVVPALIEEAKRLGGGEFFVASYEDIAAGSLKRKADVVVANFSLIGKDSVANLLRAIPALLEPRGALVIQTLHPATANGELPYEDGWREGSWSGFSEEFTDPAPWYFRTMASWKAQLSESGLCLVDLREPVHPATAKPASVIFIAEAC